MVGYKDTNCHQATCYNDPKPGGENFWIEGCDPTQVLFLTIGYATVMVKFHLCELIEKA